MSDIDGIVSHATESVPHVFLTPPESCDTAVQRATKPGSRGRLLFISYAFPPTGGGGVQRSVKFTKYLQRYGWDVTVLTAANPSVPLQDNDLNAEVSDSISILRAKTLEPSYSVKQQLNDSGRNRCGQLLRTMIKRAGMQLLQPDPQVLWSPAAFRVASRELKQRPHDAIFVTGPPFSSFLLARSLASRFALPLVLDFRDEWMLASKYLDNYRFGSLARLRQRRMMNRVLRTADSVLATTRSSAAELESCCRRANSKASVACIYNGYDEDDLVDLEVSEAQAAKLRIVYTGTLWKLTDLSPFAAAMERLVSESPTVVSALELVIAGRRTPEQESILRKLDSQGVSLEIHDYLPHRSSLKLAASADLLLVLLADQPGAERVVPAKVFEYMAIGKPILGICPAGETVELLQQFGNATTFAPHQTELLTSWLATQGSNAAAIPESRTTDVGTAEDTRSVQRFSRRHLTGELANILDSLAPRN